MMVSKKILVRCWLFLFAIASLFFQGYIYGYHDHAIQIPYIQWKLNPSLYPHDWLAESFPYYFALFWDWIAWASRYVPLEGLLLALQVLFRWLLFESLYDFALTIRDDEDSALLASAAFLFPLHTLGDFVPSPSFVHANVALPGLIYALALFLRGNILPSFLLVGFLFNVHALHAAFTGWILCFMLLTRPTLFRTSRFWVAAVLATLLGLPTLIAMVSSTALPAGPEWLTVIRLRATHHIFPFSWSWPWVSFSIYLFCGYAAFRRISIHYARELGMLATAVFTLCAIGTLFTEIHPIPFIVKMHAFRSVIFFIVALTVFISQFLVDQLRQTKQEMRSITQSAFVLTGIAALIHSAYLPLGASCLYLTSSKRKTILPTAGAILLFPFAVWGLLKLHYAFPMDSYFKMEALKTIVVLATTVPLCGLFFHEQLLHAFRIPTRTTKWAAYTALIGLSLLVFYSKEKIRAQDDFIHRLPQWFDVQTWAKNHTKLEDRFLTPPGYEGFRVFSQRGIAADWKDGTASFWDPPLAPRWLERMIEMRYLDRDSLQVIDQYDRLSVNEIENLAHRYGCRYAVFRQPAKEGIPIAYQNPDFVVYTIP